MLFTFRRALAALLLLFAVAAPALADAPPPKPASETDYSWVDRLAHQSGTVEVAEAKAHLNLGENYYFLGAADARRVLTEAWGNPPSAVGHVLGMILPKGVSPLDRTWGAVVTYEDVGYVSDEDASKIDPDKLLSDLRKGEDEDNEQRKKNGYNTLHLVGWAETPSYDAASHSAVWAQELQSGDKPEHGLNYDLRILGRRGVLSLNFVATMAELADVRAASNQVRQLASYDAGSRYADVDKKNDKMAAYGVAGMIAAGVGAAAAKKLGLLALLAVVFKKGFVVIAAAGAAVLAWFRRTLGALFGRGQKVAVAPAPAAAAPAAEEQHPPPVNNDIVQ